MLTICDKFVSTSRRISQRDTAESGLLEGASSSHLTPLTCTVGAVGVASTAKKIEITEPKDSNQPSSNTATNTTSTALVVSLPHSPGSAGESPKSVADTASTPTNTATAITATTTTTTTTTDTMPAKGAPVIITTTTAEIIDENRFALLGKDIDIYDIPSPPNDDLNARDNLLFFTKTADTNTTDSMATTPSTTPRSDTKSINSQDATSLKKKKSQHKNHNNNHPQSDINSIESISDHVKLPNDHSAEWVDDLVSQHNNKDTLQKNKRKKKNKLSSTKGLDQLDGVPTKSNHKDDSSEDEKVVKCLYYTLMCCDCSIS